MVEVSWSRLEGQDCFLLSGLCPTDSVAVRPVIEEPIAGLPAMAGQIVAAGDDLCFVPRFALVEGTTYSVLVNGVETRRLRRPLSAAPPTTEVLEIYPTAGEVPRNLLRLYVKFSAPMSEGQALQHVDALDGAGEPIVGAILPGEYELWDAAHTRLTILFDPARIKRGLVAHRALGYPLQAGGSFQLVVDKDFLDAQGLPLRSGAVRRYAVGDDERRRVEPGSWEHRVPAVGTKSALQILFPRPLDHALLSRCIHVVGPDGHRLDGIAGTGPEERSWEFRPNAVWAQGEHHLIVDAVVEDLAGNSVSRVFDRDLDRVEDDPLAGDSVAASFHPLEPG
jgi:hypothetical protein